MPSIGDLIRPYARRPLVKGNLAYYLWRFGANAARTGRAMVTPRAFKDVDAIAGELHAQGIVVGPSERFLSSSGQAAQLTSSAPASRLTARR